jgi:hypothetical protein
MIKLMRITLLCALVLTANIASSAQSRSANTARRKAPKSAPQILCQGDPIPNGYVIVGHKSAAKCGDKFEVVIKKPDVAEIVCNDSPIPEGYHVANQLSSTDCLTRATTSSANAQSIVLSDESRAERSTAPRVGDSPIGRAFASGSSNIQVEGEGKVIRVLPDDLNGSRHQRFIVKLASGQTLLLTHNIDIAPRLDGLEIGDSVSFNGEYVWNAKGGVIHWTHHDPQGRHVTGWIKHNGQIFK